MKFVIMWTLTFVLPSTALGMPVVTPSASQEEQRAPRRTFSASLSPSSKVTFSSPSLSSKVTFSSPSPSSKVTFSSPSPSSKTTFSASPSPSSPATSLSTSLLSLSSSSEAVLAFSSSWIGMAASEISGDHAVLRKRREQKRTETRSVRSAAISGVQEKADAGSEASESRDAEPTHSPARRLRHSPKRQGPKKRLSSGKRRRLRRKCPKNRKTRHGKKRRCRSRKGGKKGKKMWKQRKGRKRGRKGGRKRGRKGGRRQNAADSGGRKEVKEGNPTPQKVDRRNFLPGQLAASFNNAIPLEYANNRQSSEKPHRVSLKQLVSGYNSSEPLSAGSLKKQRQRRNSDKTFSSNFTQILSPLPKLSQQRFRRSLVVLLKLPRPALTRGGKHSRIVLVSGTNTLSSSVQTTNRLERQSELLRRTLGEKHSGKS